MAAVVYLKRRCETCPEPVSPTDGVPIRRAEWLATIARDPTLVLRPEIECGCAEWLGDGPGEAGPVARAGGEDAAGPPPPRLVFHRRGHSRSPPATAGSLPSWSRSRAGSGPARRKARTASTWGSASPGPTTPGRWRTPDWASSSTMRCAGHRPIARAARDRARDESVGRHRPDRCSPPGEYRAPSWPLCSRDWHRSRRLPRASTQVDAPPGLCRRPGAVDPGLADGRPGAGGGAGGPRPLQGAPPRRSTGTLRASPGAEEAGRCRATLKLSTPATRKPTPS